MASESQSMTPIKVPLIAQLFRASSGSAYVAAGLGFLAIISGLLTYSVLTQQTPERPDPVLVNRLLAVNLVIALALAALILFKIGKLFAERRRGSAGAKLHIRLVTLFALIAIVPTIIVAAFSRFVLDQGVDSWFSERVRTAVDSSVQVAEAYIKEHSRNIEVDIRLMANDINSVAVRAQQDRVGFNGYLSQQAALRKLSAAYVIDGDANIFSATWLEQQGEVTLPKPADLATVTDKDPSIFGDQKVGLIRAILKLSAFDNAYLYVVRPVQPSVLGYYRTAEDAANKYASLENNRTEIIGTFQSLYVLVALLILLTAVWLGLWVADLLVSPIARVIAAAERISHGDMAARVAVGPESDEISTLGRTFNHMTGRLLHQQELLMEANRKSDNRRRFTEAVLSGVSSGVIGLDSRGAITLANRAARHILDLDEEESKGLLLAEIVPELKSILSEMAGRGDGPGRPQIMGRQVDIERDGRTINLNVSIVREASDEASAGYIVTVDDISELISAQRTSAWADVARRIAHEIKNPLTPIQLSAERLKRKYRKEITTDPDIFEQCTETIIRQVTDIGRMADEFSSFARMPAPVFAPANLVEIVRQTVFMQKVAQQAIEFELSVPDHAVEAECDARLIAQSLTNLIKNAGESVAARVQQDDGDGEPGKITVVLASSGVHVKIEVIDNGVGLPVVERNRLTEPYMTTRKKGTGLGLAIVRKVMEDHKGNLILDDAPGGRGAMVRLVFPHKHGSLKPDEEAEALVGSDRETEEERVHA